MADETAFQPGDVVQLKSGGPLVTISALVDEGQRFTYYYVNGKGVIYEQQESVLALAFRKADPPGHHADPHPFVGG